MTTNIQLHKLIEPLNTAFNLSELHNLCFHLGADSENFPPLKGDFTLELLKWCERTNNHYQLLTLCQKLRPNVNWIELLQNADFQHHIIVSENFIENDVNKLAEDNINNERLPIKVPYQRWFTSLVIAILFGFIPVIIFLLAFTLVSTFVRDVKLSFTIALIPTVTTSIIVFLFLWSDIMKIYKQARDIRSKDRT